MQLVKYRPCTHECILFHDRANSEFRDDKERKVEPFATCTKPSEYSRRFSVQLFNDAGSECVNTCASIQSHVGVNLPTQNYGYDYQPIGVRCERQCCRLFLCSNCRRCKKEGEHYSRQPAHVNLLA